MVCFIAGEGHNGLARRFVAWSKKRGVTIDDAPLFKSERAAQFLDKASAVAVVQAVDALAAEHGPPALIIVDTLARNFGPGDENATADMSAFVATMSALRERYTGSTVLIVHHSGHADHDRGRGSIALKAAADLEYRVTKDGRNVRVINTKMKDSEPPADLHLELQNVQLHGNTSSGAFRLTDAPEREARLTPTQQMALTTYEQAALASGIFGEDGFQGVRLDDWREAFYASHTGDNDDAKRKAFQRVRKDLVEKGQMIASADAYLATDQGVVMNIILQRNSGT